MKLYEYLDLMSEGEELTVWDKDYDMETYFYGGKPDDKWDKAMSDLSKLLTIEEIRNNGVIVNLSEIIENKLENLNKADLFIRCNIDSIMDNIDNIHIEVAHTANEEAAREFVKELRKHFGVKEEIICDPLSLSVSCHIGPGALAVACSKAIPK